MEKLLYFLISGVVLFFMGLAWYLVKLVIKNLNTWRLVVNEKLDKMIEELRNIGITNRSQDERLKNTDEKIIMHDRRLNSHADKIRSLERKQALCRNYRDHE